jgi:hypothetical protein
MTGFERFAIWVTAGAFQIGSDERPLFYPYQSARAFAFSTRDRWRRLRVEISILLSFVVLAMITSTAGRPVLSIFKLAGIIVALVVPWVRLRGLERVHEVFRKEEADHVRRVVMDRSLALGLIELGAGWGAVSTFLVRADLQLAMLILLVVGTGLVIDGLRRLRERRPVPPDIALTWSSGASVREVPEP